MLMRWAYKRCRLATLTLRIFLYQMETACLYPFQAHLISSVSLMLIWDRWFENSPKVAEVRRKPLKLDIGAFFYERHRFDGKYDGTRHKSNRVPNVWRIFICAAGLSVARASRAVAFESAHKKRALQSYCKPLESSLKTALTIPPNYDLAAGRNRYL